MSKVKVLFFAADPLSIQPDRPKDRLRLDEDVRRIREKVRAAKYRDALELDLRLAARTDDLLQALNEVHPQVVHFSGHGNVEGLIVSGAEGWHPHVVPAAALAKLFQIFRGDIHLVVLNACSSLPQARAIADVVGCAIGTRGRISDDAAITFGAAFYRGIAFGHSVLGAFNQAQAALAMQYFEERDCFELVAGPGVDPAQLVLVAPDGTHAREPETAAPPPPPPPRRRARQAGAAGAVFVGAVLAGVILFDWPADKTPPECVPQESIRPLAALSSPVAASSAPADSSTAADLAAGRDLYHAGNYDAAFPIIQRAAVGGSMEAKGLLGIMYLNGQGTSRDTLRGLDLLREAGGAPARDVRAMNALADAYRDGDGARQSDRWALDWYKKGAAVGDAEAMRETGRMYQQGRGEPRNDSLALDWFRKAALAGSVDAMVDAGRMYENGLGTPRSPGKARRCYLTAAEAGLPRGMFEMGQMHENGVGGRRDYRRAAVWYRKAADAGSADAMNNLGVLYDRGLGVPQDRAEAIRWFSRAAQAGSTIAAANLDTLHAN